MASCTSNRESVNEKQQLTEQSGVTRDVVQISRTVFYILHQCVILNVKGDAPATDSAADIWTAVWAVNYIEPNLKCVRKSEIYFLHINIASDCTLNVFTSINHSLVILAFPPKN